MSNTFLRLWLICWVIGLPLVHIHPEVDHAHGVPGHVHGGTYHTDLSSTPICAYEDHRHHHEPLSAGEPLGTSDAPSHVPHGLEHATYSFTVLNSSIDVLLDGSTSSSALDVGVSHVTATPRFTYAFAEHLFSLQFPSLIIANTLAPRAPPIFSL